MKNYVDVLQDYFYSNGGCTDVVVTPITDTEYTVEVYYTDEEIENYLDQGSSMTFSVKNLREVPEENAICFDVQFTSIFIPGLDRTDNRSLFSDVPSMECSLLEEVARAAQKFLRYVRIGENWLDLA